jgi:deoxyribodipyrimidine photo-lyase
LILAAIMNKPYDTGLVWFRRDLRVHDHPALLMALQQCRQVHCAFILDRDILDALPRADRRVAFILATLAELDADLGQLSPQPHAGLIVRHASARQAVPALARELGATAVFAAHDYEPQALVRDAQVRDALAADGCALHTCKDHVVFEGRDLLTRGGTPYTVFTPYKRTWLESVSAPLLAEHNPRPQASALAPRPPQWRLPVPTAQDIGFDPAPPTTNPLPTGASGARRLLADFFDRIDRYHETRDFPAVTGPSHLGTHVRFGTVSVRQLTALALQRSVSGSRGAEIWLSELIWREFYLQILANFPHVATGAFRREYDAITWESGPRSESLFAAWCAGRTGYPLVDAAMAQLNQTGYMHNRLRMVSASFLVKDLGIDWRWGERYFAEQLLDFDLAANNGGWQWVSSSGCDAQPYFRIFNPVSQSKKFDPDGQFIRRYLPQLAHLPARAVHAPWLADAGTLRTAGIELGKHYPLPLVDHAQARLHTLQRYAVVREKSNGPARE